MRESQIEARLSRGVKQAGGLCLKWVSPGCTGVIFVELKQPGGRLSERQKWMADALARLGMDVRCLWNKEQVDKFLEEVGQDGVPSA